MGLGGSLDILDKENLLVVPAIEPLFVGCPACCLATAVYQLYYPGCLDMMHIFVIFYLLLFFYFYKICNKGYVMFCILCCRETLLFSLHRPVYSKFSLKCPSLMLWN